jgi:hypothetical protein
MTNAYGTKAERFKTLEGRINEKITGQGHYFAQIKEQ